MKRVGAAPVLQRNGVPTPARICSDIVPSIVACLTEISGCLDDIAASAAVGAHGIERAIAAWRGCFTYLPGVRRPGRKVNKFPFKLPGMHRARILNSLVTRGANASVAPAVVYGQRDRLRDEGLPTQARLRRPAGTGLSEQLANERTGRNGPNGPSPFVC